MTDQLPEAGRRGRRAAIGVCLAFCVMPLLGGCADQPTTQPSTVSQRADEALRDPFGYKPDAGFRDVSGGDLGHFDKDGMKKDLNDVLNP